MASIVWKRGVLLESLVDIAGFKAGLVLSIDEVKRTLSDHSALLDGEPSGLVRTRAEDFDGIVQSLLFALGAAATSEPASPMDLYAKYYPDRRKLDVYNAVGDIVGRITMAHVLDRKPGPIDLTGLIAEAQGKFGELGGEIAKDWCQLAHRATNESPWNRMRYVDWKDQVELQALFTSTDLSTSYGTFFDQRFVDYLASNFGSIDEINWRQFEGLTAEYFKREGAHVQLGPGANDDGVDVRVWWPGDDVSKPAAILVQCKRHKAKIGKTIIKALYADVEHERAKSGLIVTTQALSPGAEKTRVARAYPIESAGRSTLKSWVQRMRTERVLLL